MWMGSTDQLTSHDNQLPLPSSKLSFYQALSHAIRSICLLRIRLPTMIHLCWRGLWAGLEWIRQFDWPEVGFVRRGWGVNNVTVVWVKSINMIVLSLPLVLYHPLCNIWRVEFIVKPMANGTFWEQGTSKVTDSIAQPEVFGQKGLKKGFKMLPTKKTY